jgi:flagellar basal body rod protein FlgB
MNLLSLISDNISDLLVRIIEFTHTRQRVLTENIRNIHTTGFMPKDLAVGEFSQSLNEAIVEHVQSHRLVLRDTNNIKFGESTSLQATPIVDEYAGELLEHNKDEYLELQINKLLENLLNQKIAAELLRQKQQTFAFFHRRAADKPTTRQSGSKFAPMYWDKKQH